MNQNKRVLDLVKYNIDFVERCIDHIENLDYTKEKEIVYRELGSISLSAIEAFSKLVLVEISEKCNENKCKDKCDYCQWKTKKTICEKTIKPILLHLINTRLIWFTQDEIDKLGRLMDLRNYIHLSKYLEEAKQEVVFDRNYVECLLNYYYELEYQYKLNTLYFNNPKACLREYDSNGYCDTKEFNCKDKRDYYNSKMYNIFEKKINCVALSNEDNWIINNITREHNFLNFDCLAELIARSLYYKRYVIKDNNIIKIENETYSKILNEMKIVNLDKKIREELERLFHD